MLTQPHNVSAQAGTLAFADIGEIATRVTSGIDPMTVVYVVALLTIVVVTLRGKRKRRREERLMLDLSESDLRRAMGLIKKRYATGRMDDEIYQRLHDAMRGQR